MPPESRRVVSLLPSATEWVYALGLQHHLVGVTFECDEPPTARTDHAVVVGGLDTAGLAPGEVDALVRSRAAAGHDLYRLDEDAMARLAPDVVLTQDLCRVCALPADAVDQALQRAGCPSSVVRLDPVRLGDVLDGAVLVGDGCGAEEAGRRLRAALQARLDAVAGAVADGVRRGVTAPRRVLVLEWVDPPFLPGHWVPDLVEAAGAVPVLASPGGRSTSTTWDALADACAREPVDAVLVAPCGYGLGDAVTQATSVLDRLERVAGPDVRVWAVDAGAAVTRPGPRVVDGVEALAAALHPALARDGVLVQRPDLVAVVR